MTMDVIVREQDHSGRVAVSRRHMEDMSNSGHQYLRLKISLLSRLTHTQRSIRRLMRTMLSQAKKGDFKEWEMVSRKKNTTAKLKRN